MKTYNIVMYYIFVNKDCIINIIIYVKRKSFALPNNIFVFQPSEYIIM